MSTTQSNLENLSVAQEQTATTLSPAQKRELSSIVRATTFADHLTDFDVYTAIGSDVTETLAREVEN